MPIEIPSIYAAKADDSELPSEAPQPEKKVTLWTIAFGVFLGNLLTGLLASVLYFILR